VKVYGRGLEGENRRGTREAIEQFARFLDERDDGLAARSLRQEMKEMVTLQRLRIPATLHKCLAAANVIETPRSGVERRTGNGKRFRDLEMEPCAER